MRPSQEGPCNGQALLLASGHLHATFADHRIESLVGTPEEIVRRRLVQYLDALGVDTIWLAPFQPSPDRDDGYDIADYYSINPMYGTLRDFKAFLREAHRRGWRCVRVVHGKGLGSPGKTPVLKGKVHGWLVQKSEVLAFVQARGDEGGAGAVVVLLKPG